MNKRVGALWKRSYGDGETMLSGNVDLGVGGKVDIGIFPNDKKTADNQPDYYITIREEDRKPKPQEAVGTTAERASTPKPVPDETTELEPF